MTTCTNTEWRRKAPIGFESQSFETVCNKLVTKAYRTWGDPRSNSAEISTHLAAMCSSGRWTTRACVWMHNNKSAHARHSSPTQSIHGKRSLRFSKGNQREKRKSLSIFVKTFYISTLMFTLMEEEETIESLFSLNR